MFKVYGYIRVSTTNQYQNGYSLEEQREEIKRYCKENGYELIRIYEDAGISGAKANGEDLSIEERQGLLDLFEGIKKLDIKYVVVLTTSRLWRDDLSKVIIHRELKKRNIDIKAIDRPNYSIYEKNPSDYLVNGVLELLDSYERMEIALKLKRGRIQKAKEGGYSGGGVPYGYKNQRGSKKLEIEPKEAEAVRRVFELANMCPWLTLKEISDTLNEEGYRGRKGKFNTMLVKRILDKEEFYRGIYVYSDIKVKGNYEKIL